MIIDNLLTKLAPYECLACRREGQLLCAGCRQLCQVVPSRCYRCRRPTEAFTVCTTCKSVSSLYKVMPAVVYGPVARDLIWQLKFNGAQSAAREMASFIVLPEGAADLLLVPVLTATSRTRRRGYDQAKLLTKQLARRYQLPYCGCLLRMGQTEQLGANRQQRLQQLEQAFRCPKPAMVADKHVVLVDDVLTTGATLEAAAGVMLFAGAAKVSAVVFAQA